MVTPCNMHIDGLARSAAEGADGAGGKAVIFNTITVSDGISMGTPGMRYSLVSREVIADSIEAVTAAEGFDGLVTIGGHFIADRYTYVPAVGLFIALAWSLRGRAATVFAIAIVIGTTPDEVPSSFGS